VLRVLRSISIDKIMAGKLECCTIHCHLTCNGVQNLRPRKEQFADLLGSFHKPRFFPVGQRFEHYQLKNGEITPVTEKIEVPDEDGNTIVIETDPGWIDENRAEDENLFLSFVDLGARGRPSDGAILDWVHLYGLLWRTEGVLPWNERMDVEDFRREVLCARQMLDLYKAVRTGNLGFLDRLPASDMRGGWKFTPPTVVDRLRESDRKSYGLEDPHSSLGNAWKLLREAMQEKLGEGVRPTFTSSPEDPLGFRQGWYIRDLHSAIFLAFYLFITEGGPVRFCEACGRPIKVKSRRQRHCNDTCRSNARHKRNRQKKREQETQTPAVPNL
jgi:hypothetical protein